ncbi:MAG: YihY/virulence factor BrkB family protein [Bacilli bacterium]
MNKIKHYLKRLYKIVNKNELKILPGQIAFFLVLSLVPFITLFAYIASQFNIDINFIVESLNGSLPDQIIGILKPALMNPGILTGLSILIGFYISSNGTNSIIVASNMLFKLEDSSFIKRRIKAIIMLLILVLLLFFMITGIAFGNELLTFIFKVFFKSNIPLVVYQIYLLLKWTFGIFLIFLMIKMIYTIAPDSPIPSKNMNKGVIFTTVMWIVATGVYSYYVVNYAHYNLFYGSLANIVVLMFWIYILSYTFVLGIAINSDDYLKDTKK